MRDPGPGIADLIHSFLKSASYNCAPGTFVCVGITTHEDYMHQYHLEHILGDNLNSCTLGQYEFLGVDNVLINKLLSYGYKHVPCDIEGCHVTLVFRLKCHIFNGVLNFVIDINGNMLIIIHFTKVPSPLHTHQHTHTIFNFFMMFAFFILIVSHNIIILFVP